jgi:hypothetical protein
MAATKAAKFGLGVYWPDDYTDYLVHFHEPFAVFRIEADREGPILLWCMGGGDLAGFSDQEFSRFLGEAEAFLALEGVIHLGADRHAEFRESRAPFPPCLVVSNRSNTFSAIVGLGERPFTATFNPDESGPLFLDFDVGFDGATDALIGEISRSAELFYEEFYDRQIFLENLEKTRKRRQLKGDPDLHSLN